MCIPRGPLRIHVAPNGLPRPRLGLAVGRRVGPAVRRNRIKRLLREAFRTIQHELPEGPDGSYDYVVNVRPHDIPSLDQYRAHLLDASRIAHRRLRARAEGDPSPER